ncbi:MAG: BLUF domain-containing protein, partial [Pseudomonadota bacterium]
MSSLSVVQYRTSDWSAANMYRLVYVSTAVDDLGDEDVASILDVSESNNHERYITGFLAHNGRSFMQ